MRGRCVTHLGQLGSYDRKKYPAMLQLRSLVHCRMTKQLAAYRAIGICLRVICQDVFCLRAVLGLDKDLQCADRPSVIAYKPLWSAYLLLVFELLDKACLLPAL